MNWIFLALSLGFLGSFHCVGMCGPIALALPIQHLTIIKKELAVLVYNLGRAFTYSLLGLFFGLLGQGFYVGGFQQLLSVALGIIILLTVLLPKLKIVQFQKLGFTYSYINRLKNKLRQLFGLKGWPVLFLIGLLNGLLPCGLVYVGIAGAMATGNYLHGAVFMFFFGIGTVPVMMSLSVFGQFIKMKYRNGINKSVPFVISIMAVLLILRGLNLGIPYISPRIEENDPVALNACHSSPAVTIPGQTIRCRGKTSKSVSQTQKSGNSSESIQNKSSR